MSTKYISLEEVPEILKTSLLDNFTQLPGSKLLSITEYTSTPYIDKSITDIRYTAHVQTGNYYQVFKYSVRSNPEWTDREVQNSGMIASEIIEFIKQCDWLQRAAIEDVKRDEK